MKHLNAFFFDEVDLSLKETFPFYGTLLLGLVTLTVLALVVY